MPIPTDRGYVWVTPEDGDTQNVQIATTIEGGRPAVSSPSTSARRRSSSSRA
jgi:hypothetical protein